MRTKSPPSLSLKQCETYKMLHLSTDTHLYLCNKAPVLTLSLFALCFASVRMCLPGVWEVWYNLLDYTA